MIHLNELSTRTIWSRDFVLLLLVEANMQLGMYLVRPIVSTYALALGAALVLASFLGGLNATTAMLMRPITGIIADRLGKKPLLIASCALFAFSGIGCALASTIPAFSFFCALQGIAFAMRSTVMTGMVALIVPKDRIATSLGYMGISYTLGASIGPLIGTFIGKATGYDAAFGIATILYTIGLLLALSLKAPASKSNPPTNTRNATKNENALFYRPAIPLSLSAGLLMIAHGSMNAMAIMLDDMGFLQGAAFYFTVYALVSVIAKPLSGRVADEHGARSIVSPCMALAAAGMTLLAFCRNTPCTLIAAICMGIGQASAYSAMQAEAVRDVSEEELGRATSTFFLGPDLGMGLGPVASGIILNKWGVQAMFLFANACVILGALTFVASSKK